MNVPATVSVPIEPHGTKVPPGWTINGQQVPANTHFTQGAGRAHYEKPRVVSNNPVSPQSASRYRQYLNKYNPTTRNVGRPAETSFSNPPASSRDPISDISRNTEGVRQRRPLQGQGSSRASSSSVRTNGSAQGTTTSPSTSIQIEPFQLSESVPLLGTAGSTSLSGGLALGAGAVAGGLALGGATSAVINRIKEKGAVLPGTDYVGPGNDIKIDAPRSESDAIAKEHDIGYADFQRRADLGELTEQEFVEGIDYLDNTAIEKFAENFHNSGEWQSFLGRWGLWLKNRIERVTGPLYPSFPGKTWASGRIFHRIKNQIGLV